MDVRACGAKGDGSSDDWEALQKAVDESEGAIVFGPGTFRISRGLVVDLRRRGKTEIRGEGARIINEGDQPALHIIGTHERSANPDYVTHDVWSRESTPLVHGIEITSANRSADGIRLELTWQPVITHVTIHDCRHGIHAVRNNRNVIISNSHIYHNSGVGIFLDEVNLHQVIINTNHVSYNALGGIKVLEGNVRNIQVCGNDIEYNYDHVGQEEVVADVWLVGGKIGIREGTVVGNTIQAQMTKNGANVRIEGFAQEGNRKAGLLNVTGNLITNQEYNILILDSRGIAVQGNTFLTGPKRNIRVVRSGHIAVGPNVIDNNPDYKLGPRGGIELDSCTGCAISGVVLHHAHGEDEASGAIDVQGSRAINITGCSIIEPEYCGVVLRGTKDSRVSDCIIGGGRNAVLEDSACENNMIVHNRICGSSVSCHGAGTIQEGNLVTRQ